MNHCKVPKNVILRMGKYFQWLNIEGRSIKNISSRQLGEKVGESATRIRHDFAYFGDFSIQGKGYNTEKLRKRLAEILGLDNERRSVIMVGNGQIGSAMLNCGLFERLDLDIKYRFIEDLSETDTQADHVVLKSYDEMNDCVRHEKPGIAVICTRDEQSQAMSMQLYDMGVRSYLNTTKTMLRLPEDTAVENISLELSLMSLSYNLSRKRAAQMN